MPKPTSFAPPPLTALLARLGTTRGKPLRVGVVSDVHGQHKRPALDLFCAQAEPDVLLCCGDLQDYRGGYPVPMIFTHGNHECWTVLAELDSGKRTPVNLARLPDAVPVSLGGARVAAIGGCRATVERGLPKHISPASVERMRSLRAEVVLSHDTPIRYDFDPSRTVEPLREIAQRMAPRFWFSGHHHRWATEQLGRTTIVSLGKWPDEWGVLEIDRGSISDFDRFVPRSSGYHTRKARWKADEQVEKGILFPLDRADRRYGVDD